MIYFWLLLIHLIYDWHLQGEFVWTFKSRLITVLGVHCLTWAMLMSIPLFYFNAFLPWMFSWLLGTHFVIDYWKCRVLHPEDRLTEKYLLIDQLLHVISVVIVLI